MEDHIMSMIRFYYLLCITLYSVSVSASVSFTDSDPEAGEVVVTLLPDGLGGYSIDGTFLSTTITFTGEISGDCNITTIPESLFSRPSVSFVYNSNTGECADFDPQKYAGAVSTTALPPDNISIFYWLYRTPFYLRYSSKANQGTTITLGDETQLVALYGIGSLAQVDIARPVTITLASGSRYYCLMRSSTLAGSNFLLSEAWKPADNITVTIFGHSWNLGELDDNGNIVLDPANPTKPKVVGIGNLCESMTVKAN
jgi:hypothetical protein